jgi:hypothetical protein
LVIGALAIIVGLSFYAGKLLFQLKAQRDKQTKIRNERIETILTSVRTIAMAMAQQQCEISEGVIRLTHLLDALPLQPAPDFAAQYPGIYTLHQKIAHFDTHDKRAALSKAERRQQDRERGSIEAEYESQIIGEVTKLQHYRID